METASQDGNETAGQLAADVVIVATAEESQEAAIADLDRRIRELESAIAELRTVKASAATGRKTAASMAASGSDAAGVNDALRSLSVEQRIAVKSGLMRAGVL